MSEYAVASRLFERDYPDPAIDFGVAKALGGHVEVSERPLKRKQFPASITHSLSNGQQHQRPRALINAYRSDKKQQTSSSKSLLVEPLNINGIDNKVLSTSLQNTEEEFDWEDMSPTLSSTIGFSRERPAVAANATLSEQDASKGWCIRDFRRAPLDEVPRFQNQINYSLGSSQPHDPSKISLHPSNSSQHNFSNRGRARSLTIPPIDNIRNTDINPYLVRPTSFEIRPSTNLNVTRPPTLNPITPLQKRVRSQFEATHTSDPFVNHVNKSSFMPEQLFDCVEYKHASISKINQLPNQRPGLISSTQQNHGQAPQLQFFPSQDPTPSQFSRESSWQLHDASISTAMPNPLHAILFPSPVQSIANNPFIGYTSLISSLMSQGVISLANKLPAQDSIGTEFNPDILKVRHESSMNALYGDLPRQCKTCGLRFRCQEEHSSHMDWHVTKNRMSKSLKQKPSRKWFASVKLWLSGTEALGTESVPHFLATESIDYEERKDHIEFAVPAEEDQSTCALCGESFDEFYSDEMEEWMCRGAAYLNAPTGTTTAGMDRSQLGPIIHAKCRSDSHIQCADKRIREGNECRVD